MEKNLESVLDLLERSRFGELEEEGASIEFDFDGPKSSYLHLRNLEGGKDPRDWTRTEWQDYILSISEGASIKSVLIRSSHDDGTEHEFLSLPPFRTFIEIPLGDCDERV